MHSITARTRREAGPHHCAEAERLNRLEAEFLRSRRLLHYRVGPRNLRTILASWGGDRTMVREVLAEFFAGGHAIPGIFDHAVLLGRDGRAVMLVGHPYPAEYDRMFTTVGDRPGGGLRLRQALAGIGVPLYAGTPAESFYGFGTFHIRIERRPEA